MIEREGSIISLEQEVTPMPVKVLHFGSQVYGINHGGGSSKRHQSLNSWHFHNAPTVLKKEFSLKRVDKASPQQRRKRIVDQAVSNIAKIKFHDHLSLSHGSAPRSKHFNN